MFASILVQQTSVLSDSSIYIYIYIICVIGANRIQGICRKRIESSAILILPIIQLKMYLRIICL